jgi:hypothetical protein
VPLADLEKNGEEADPSEMDEKHYASHFLISAAPDGSKLLARFLTGFSGHKEGRRLRMPHADLSPRQCTIGNYPGSPPRAQKNVIIVNCPWYQESTK